jgi:beta-barrel assembly-enhancing protease
MNRRRWLRWGCAHCAALAGIAPEAMAQAPAWTAPPRFTRPDLATDEGGLWAMMDREEQRLRRSPFRIRDEALGAYLAELSCRLGGGHCPDIRVYAVRAAWFNANMAPNGMMQIWSGLLLRADNEAQLASVIGHEIGHYLQRHTVERLRDLRARSAFGSFISLFGIVGAIGALATMASALAFSRDQEREADRIGLDLLRTTGHDPREASIVWSNLIEELKATPGADPSQNSILFATHPPSDERRATLELLASGGGGERHESAYRARIAPLRAMLLEDELKRSRPFETVVLMTRKLGLEPGAADLLHCRGEAYRQRGQAGDEALALADFETACAAAAAPARAFRSLAELHRSAGRKQPAHEAFTRYLDLAPDSPDAGMVRQTLEELK